MLIYVIIELKNGEKLRRGRTLILKMERLVVVEEFRHNSAFDRDAQKQRARQRER
jgi:hypothetical protein